MTYYKVVKNINKNLCSWFVWGSKCGVRYIKNKWTYPKKGQPPLYVTTSLQHAQSMYGSNWRNRVYECQIGKVVSNGQSLIGKQDLLVDKVMIIRRVL